MLVNVENYEVRTGKQLYDLLNSYEKEELTVEVCNIIIKNSNLIYGNNSVDADGIADDWKIYKTGYEIWDSCGFDADITYEDWIDKYDEDFLGEDCILYYVNNMQEYYYAWKLSNGDYLIYFDRQWKNSLK